MSDSTVRFRPRLVDSVAKQLRDWIVTGKLPAGTQLLQVDLAEQLQVSRTPLREAFRVLERDGLVRTSNNNRTVEVVPITLTVIADMYRVRERMDGLAARQAAERGMSEDDELRARSLLGAMRQAVEPEFDSAARVQAHAEFHELIAQASGNVGLESVLPVIRTSSAAMHLPILGEPGNLEIEHEGRTQDLRSLLTGADSDHETILDLIIAGDASGADQAAQDHVRRTLRILDHYDDWLRLIGGGSLAQVESAPD